MTKNNPEIKSYLINQVVNELCGDNDFFNDDDHKVIQSLKNHDLEIIYATLSGLLRTDKTLVKSIYKRKRKAYKNLMYLNKVDTI